MTDAITRPMTIAALETVLSWAADEGWNPGLSDAEAFHAADPGGFFQTSVYGELVAAVSVVNHDAGNAFLGLYLCRPEWRGQGIGMATWNHALEHAGARSVGLDGVPAQEGNYRKSGFVRVGATLRHEGRLPGKASSRIRVLEASDMPALAALDRQAIGHGRERFLTAWLEGSETRGTRVLIADGEIGGFAAWRACGTGTKIGPVIAPDTGAALELIADIGAVRTEGPLIADVPEGNGALRAELAQAGFTVPFATARMYRGQVPESGPALQAIATMELG